MEELIPWLYLKGVSIDDFGQALESLIGPSAKGFSPNVIVRLKERWGGKYDEWSRCDLTAKQYGYVWADVIHVRIRLEDPANPKQCLLVVMGATADGQKELIAVIDGVRESEQSWRELLLDLKSRTPPDPVLTNTTFDNSSGEEAFSHIDSPTKKPDGLSTVSPSLLETNI